MDGQTKRPKARKAGNSKTAKRTISTQAETPAPIESFLDLNWRSGRLALGWIITVVDLYFTSPKGAGSLPRGRLVDGKLVSNPARDLRAEAAARELRHNAEAVRTVHPELGLAELPTPVGSADEDVSLLGQWARAALVSLQGRKQGKQPRLQVDDPPDPIRFAAAVQRYSVSRSTLQRAVDAGQLRTYRKRKSGQHVLSEAAVSGLYPKR